MSDSTILAVDLDGTLVRTDLLFEAFWKGASEVPGQVVGYARSLLSGRAHLKQVLSDRVHLNAASLNYDPDVIDYIREWKDKGGRVALVTASHQSYAEDVAAHLGLFDEVHGTRDGVNLKGGAKAKFLVERFGAGGYVYIGDTRADLPVWESAKSAVAVGVSDSFARDIRSLGGDLVRLPGKPADPKAFIRTLRPHQWLKNLLVFLPVLATHGNGAGAWLASLIAFVAYSMMASGVYVLNDLLDLSSDRAHPRKCRRPIPSGAVPLPAASVMAVLLPLGGLGLSTLTGHPLFSIVLFVYYLMSLAYSLHIKRKLILDICTLAGLYTMRIIGGAFATGLLPSVWLLAFSIFIFLSLAAIKRQAELVDALQGGRAQISGRGYQPDDLPVISNIAISAGYTASLVMALYLYSPTVQQLYPQPMFLWGVCPVLIYWVSRMTMFAHRGRMDDDPIVFAARDSTSRACFLLILLFVALASTQMAWLH